MKRGFPSCAVGLVLLAACSGGSGHTGGGGNDGETSSPPTAVGTIGEATATGSEVVPTVFAIDFSTSIPGSGWIEFSTDDGRVLESPPDASATEHRAFMLGAKAAHTYTVTPKAQFDGGSIVSGDPIEIDTPGRPSSMIGMNVEPWDPAVVGPDPFYILLVFSAADPWTIIIDQDGDPVWWVNVPENPKRAILMAKPTLDGTAILDAQFDYEGQPPEPYGGIKRTPMTVMSASEQSITKTPEGNHDFADLGDRIAFVSHITVDQPIETIADVPVETDQIKVNPIGGTAEDASLLWQIDTGYSKPIAYCEHTGPGGSKDEGYWMKWAHVNSLMYLPSQDALYANSRYHDALIKIDATTGETLDVFSGPLSDYTVTNGDPEYHGHMSQVWDDGYTIFSNRDHQGTSEVIRFSIDTANHQLTREWSYPEPDGATIPVLGDADWLPNGNYLVSWANLAKLEIINPDHEVIWRANADNGDLVGRAQLFTDLYHLTTYP